MSAKNFKVFLQRHSNCWAEGYGPPGKKSVRIIGKLASLAEIIFIAYNYETFKIMSKNLLNIVSFNHSPTIQHNKTSMGAFLETVVSEVTVNESKFALPHLSCPL